MLKKKALHYLLLLSFVVLGFTANANTYYISNDGNDSNSGTDASSPWQTLNKLNSVSLSAGDNILFRRGDTFYGKIILNIQSASSSTPITYGAYGSGNKPIITGFTSVTSWTNKGGNIWESTNAVSTLTTMAQVVINGQSVPMGKFPNEDVTYPYLPNFYKFQSFTGTGSGASSITSSSLTDGNNWSGADLVIRVNQWTFDKTKITSQSGTTLNFNGVASTGETLAANWGFFIQNDIRTLDQQNEWYYNPSTKKIDIYSTTQPTNVQVSTVDTLLYNYSNIPQVTSISVDNIQFTGANGNAIWISGNLTFSVTNCDISYSGLEGIILYGGGIQNGTISNNNIHDNASSGIYETGDVSNLTITNNTINTSGIVSIYKTNDYGNGGMTIEAPNSLIQYNTIDSSAYCGIVFASSNFQVRNNFINHSSLVRGDAAGIYTGFANETGKIIDGNIVLNSEGNPRGAGSDDYFAMGIYCDDLGTGVQITNNTIGYARTAGIYLHNSNNLVVRNNTIFSCGALGTEVMWANGGISMDGNAGTNEIGAVYGNTVANNKVFATNQYQFDINYYDQAGSNNGPNNFGVIDSNYYVKVNSAATAIKAQLDGVSYDNMSLSGWQSLTRKDLHSHESPVVITDPINLRFEYNYSSASKVVSLDQKYIDVTGTQYNSGSITLAPYSSAVLIKNGAFISLTTHYISTTGNDETGDGTSGNPWATLVKACSSVTRAGDTIYVNPGTYVETNPAILAAGVSIKGAGTSSHIISHYKADWNYSNPTKASIVLSSDTEGTNGNQSISNILLDGDNLTANLGILVRLRSNVKIHDMSIKDFYINGINYLGSSVNSESKPTTYSTGNELYNVIIDNCTDSANTWVGGGLINVCGQKDLSIHDCTFSDTARVAGANGNIVMNNRFGLGFKYYNNTSYKPSMGNDGWNFYLEIPWGSGGTEIYNNRFYGGEQGIDIGSFAEYNYSYSFSYDIHDNYFEDTNPTATGSNGKTALYVEGARAVNVFMHNNTFKNISQPFSVIDGSTPGIAPNDTNIVFRNNICMNMGMDAPDNWQALIEINKSVGSIYGLYIINNTIVPNTVINSSAISISNHGSSMKNIVIGNNIITNSKNGYWMFVDNTNSTLDSLVIRNNILYNNANNNAITFSGNAVTNYINSGNINSDPLFVSATDLSLQSTSPAIGAAYNYGYGTDIGAIPYEGSLSVTGFNYDVIVDNVLNGTVSNLRNHDMDGWGYSFYASGFSSGSTPSQNGLPADGKILSRTGTTYQFQPWNQNNALWLNAGDTGTITLTSPHKFEKIKIALTNANGPSTVAYKVNYSDGSSDNGSFNINDWACYSCTDYAINQLGRVDGSGTLQSPVFAIYEDSIITNASKTINSIHFAPSGGTVSIFALSSAQVADTNVHELRTSHLKSVEKDEELNYMPYAEKVEINPNPFSEKLYLKIESPIQDKAVIIITDLSGRQLYKENISIGIGNNFYEINKAAGFSNGIYFISVFSTAQKKTVKVIKTGAGN
jgi:parallel beta-helix repeat protein